MKKHIYFLIGAVIISLILSTSNVIGFNTSINKQICYYDPPGPPSGPTEGRVGIEYIYCVDIPEETACEPYFIMWDWGDGMSSGWLGPYPAGETVCANHSWSEPGSYDIRVGIKDGYGREYWTDPVTVIITVNNPPSIPIIKGPNSGIPGEEYDFSLNSTDPDDDDLYYLIDWGDDIVDQTGFHPSGEEIYFSHSWAEQGTYKIKAKAIDIYGAESEWGELDITMPRDRLINILLQKLLEHFPNVFRILRNILGL